MAQGKTIQNALIGTAVTIVAFFIPFLSGIAPLFGGGVAGYLQHERIAGGAKAGIVMGIFLTVITILIGILASLTVSHPSAVIPADYFRLSWAVVYVGMFVLVVVFIIVGGIGGAIGGAAIAQPDKGSFQFNE